MQAKHIGLGKFGESKAVSYLSKRGFTILDKNFNTKFGEIDIISQKGKAIYFYEVKTRANQSFGNAEDAITPSKIKKIKKSVEVWINKYGELYDGFDLYLNGIAVDENDEILEFEIL